jgi:hypothetical protein
MLLLLSASHINFFTLVALCWSKGGENMGFTVCKEERDLRRILGVEKDRLDLGSEDKSNLGKNKEATMTCNMTRGSMNR